MYKLEGEICFTEKNSAEKYLLILTTDELLRARTPLSVRESDINLPPPKNVVEAATALAPLSGTNVWIFTRLMVSPERILCSDGKCTGTINEKGYAASAGSP